MTAARNATVAVALLILPGAPSPAAAQQAFLTNEAVIEGLHRAIDLEDPLSVFGYVFSRLDDEVVVYPSENYYYFRFWAAGRAVSGSLALPARSRDDGVLSFGYSVRNEDPSAADPVVPVGGGLQLTEAHGVRVRRIEDGVYGVVYKCRTVVFRLHVPPMNPPAQRQLAPGETYVGPVLDESGLAFHLLFDAGESHLFLVLDEREAAPESFRTLAPDLVVGERTGFAFHLDRDHGSRKVLFGVRGESVLKNDWYDGPFDQMPDNYIERGLIPGYRGYLEASYPDARGRIDQYGYYRSEDGVRLAVAPYLVYFAEADLVSIARSCRRVAPAAASFTACITRQEFAVPDGKRHLIAR